MSDFERLKSVNPDTKMYTIREGSGYSCLGFDVCEKRTRAYIEAIGAAVPEPMPYGSSEAYLLYCQMERAFCNHPAHHQTFYEPGTPEQVKRVLEDARVNHTRIRVFYGDQETGRDWNEENDVTGTVARTMGPIHSPILVANSRSHGGSIPLTNCIVKIMETRTKRVLYQHPKYHSGTFTMRPVAADECPTAPDLKFAVDRDGKTHARFKTEKQAQRYIDRMTGKAA